MHIEKVSYVDAVGNSVEEELRFNLTKAEITEMQYSVKGGLSAMIEQLSVTDDAAVVVRIVKDIILMAYGEKYTDTKGITRFLKNQDIRDAFMATEAYSVLFMKFMNDTDALNNFIVAVMPEDMRAKVAEEKNRLTATTDER